MIRSPCYFLNVYKLENFFHIKIQSKYHSGVLMNLLEWISALRLAVYSGSPEVMVFWEGSTFDHQVFGSYIWKLSCELDPHLLRENTKPWKRMLMSTQKHV